MTMHIERTQFDKKEKLHCDECGKLHQILYELTPSHAKAEGNSDLSTWYICYQCLLKLPKLITYTPVNKQ